MISFNDGLIALTPLLDQLTAGVQLIDDEMRYRYLNQAAAKHGRTTSNAVIGRTMSECYPGIENTEVYRVIKEVGRTGQADSLQNAFTFTDGSQGWFEVRMFKVPGGVVVLSVDITARKTLELHVRHADRMEAAGKLAGGIAHDFNNLLMIISSVAQLTLDDPALSATHRPRIGYVLEAAQKASLLTRKLLALSSQFPGAPPELVPLASFIPTTASSIQAMVGLSRRIDLDIASDVGHVLIDPGALEQLLVHLIQNAHDAMGDTGLVRISAAVAHENPQGTRPGAPRLTEQDYITLKISDNGPGIAAEVIEKIFDPFYSTKVGPSRGLGLAMCWGLVEQAGGTIQVHSSKGQGTTFEVLLPRVVVDQKAKSCSPAPTKSIREDGLRILVVDDEKVVLHLVCALLKRRGHQTIEAADGPTALALFKGGTPIDLVLSDLLMPEMTGLELLHHMRGDGYDAPFLIMSGYAPEHRALLEVPRSCLLSKPFSPDELEKAVASVFEEGAPQLGVPTLQ